MMKKTQVNGENHLEDFHDEDNKKLRGANLAKFGEMFGDGTNFEQEEEESFDDADDKKEEENNDKAENNRVIIHEQKIKEDDDDIQITDPAIILKEMKEHEKMSSNRELRREDLETEENKARKKHKQKDQKGSVSYPHFRKDGQPFFGPYGYGVPYPYPPPYYMTPPHFNPSSAQPRPKHAPNMPPTMPPYGTPYQHPGFHSNSIYMHPNSNNKTHSPTISMNNPPRVHLNQNHSSPNFNPTNSPELMDLVNQLREFKLLILNLETENQALKEKVLDKSNDEKTQDLRKNQEDETWKKLDEYRELNRYKEIEIERTKLANEELKRKIDILNQENSDLKSKLKTSLFESDSAIKIYKEVKHQEKLNYEKIKSLEMECELLAANCSKKEEFIKKQDNESDHLKRHIEDLKIEIQNLKGSIYRKEDEILNTLDKVSAAEIEKNSFVKRFHQEENQFKNLRSEYELILKSFASVKKENALLQEKIEETNSRNYVLQSEVSNQGKTLENLEETLKEEKWKNLCSNCRKMIMPFTKVTRKQDQAERDGLEGFAGFENSPTLNNKGNILNTQQHQSKSRNDHNDNKNNFIGSSHTSKATIVSKINMLNNKFSNDLLYLETDNRIHDEDPNKGKKKKKLETFFDNEDVVGKMFKADQQKKPSLEMVNPKMSYLNNVKENNQLVNKFKASSPERKYLLNELQSHLDDGQSIKSKVTGLGMKNYQKTLLGNDSQKNNQGILKFKSINTKPYIDEHSSLSAGGKSTSNLRIEDVYFFPSAVTTPADYGFNPLNTPNILNSKNQVRDLEDLLKDFLDEKKAVEAELTKLPEKLKTINQINRKRELESTLAQIEKNILSQKNKLKELKTKVNS